MPTIYVSSAAIITAPSDSNDGLDLFGLGAVLVGSTYNHTTRTLSNPDLVGIAALVLGAYVGVTGGTGWTAGRYLIESVNDAAGTITFAAASGVNVASSNAPTLSDGPVATLAGAHAKCPATATGHWSSYAANAAVRIAVYDTVTVGTSTLSWTAVGTASYHTRIAACNIQGWVDFNSAGQRLLASVTPGEGFTPGTPLFTLNASAAVYLDVAGTVFNAGGVCNYAVTNSSAHGNVNFDRCRFELATSHGFFVGAPRITLTRCRASSNGGAGIAIASSALNSAKIIACRAFSNTSDGFFTSGTGEGSAFLDCIAHHNGRHGFRPEGAPFNTLFRGNVSAYNAQHGFDLSGAGGGGNLNASANVAVGNGTTSSHYQYYFGGTATPAKVATFSANYAGAAGSALNTDATDLDSEQLATGTHDVLLDPNLATFDARLKGSARAALRALVPLLAGPAPATSGEYTTPPGLRQQFIAGGGGSRVLDRS